MPGAKARRLIAAACEKNIPHEPLSDQLCDNLLMLEALKRQCADLVIHEFLFVRENARRRRVFGRHDR